MKQSIAHTGFELLLHCHDGECQQHGKENDEIVLKHGWNIFHGLA